MGCAVETTDTGVMVDVHVFDTFENAEHYVQVSRCYSYKGRMPIGPAIEFYTHPSDPKCGGKPSRASIRQKDGSWRACFWVA